MHILGGTYGEVCANPGHNELFGSGLRAAAALSLLSPQVQLTSAVHFADATSSRASEREAADFVARSFGVEPFWVSRSKPVSWSYFTPLAAPSLNGAGASLANDVIVDSENILVFGLVEATGSGQPRARVRGRRVALDPQKPRDLELNDVAEIHAESVLLILNENETKQLGQSHSVEVAARNLLRFQSLPVEAVITKRAARGALVTTATGSTPVAPRWTPSVYTIGSGDVFAAAAAWAWSECGLDPVEAAQIGSAAAAYYCDRLEVPVPASAIDSPSYQCVSMTEATAQVYIAGPFFNLAQRWLIDLVEGALNPYRFSPLHDVGVGDVSVAAADINGLNRCRSVLALLDGEDPGTIFEAGYATRAAMPVICFAEHIDNEGYKMLAGTGAELTDDLTTAVYHSIWAAMDPQSWAQRFHPTSR